MKIYVKFGKQKTIREFLKKMFTINTTDQTFRGCETFSDPDCYHRQCSSNRNRSFEDIFDCVNTYYKNITPKMLIHLLLTLDVRNKKGEPMYFHMSNCGSIRAIRMLYYYHQATSLSHYTCDKYNSKYSWVQLLAMLHLKTKEDIINYVQKHRK